MATIQTINVGLAANDKKGDPLRAAMQKVNSNFTALASAIDARFAPTLIPSGENLNAYMTAGVFHQNTNAGAAAGQNYPTPYAGLLLVYTSAASFVYQFYTRFRSGPGGVQATYWRTFYSSAWTDWQEVAKKADLDALSVTVAAVQTVAQAAIPLVQKAAANGVASLDGSGRLPLAQAPILTATSLPTTAHDLNDFQTPGSYWQNQSSAATLANNYPVAGVTCFLEVTNFGSATKQEISTRVSPYRNFWRIKTGTTSWSDWKESVDNTTGLAFQGGMPSSPVQDLNTYTQRGQWAIGSSAIAASGLNFPIGQSGQLLVLSAGYPGGPAAAGCNQVYLVANSNRLFFRSLVLTTWTPWEEAVRSSLLGAANGVATLGMTGKLALDQAPSVPAKLVEAGTNANDVIEPGPYYLNSDANATAALNWPEQIAGTLIVTVVPSGNMQITQEYTTRNGTGGVLRTYKRVRFGTSGTWGLWQELARFADAMTHTFLTTATDANSLTADNTFYTWTFSGVLGANFPSFSTAWAAAGYMRVYYGASTQVSQELTYLVTGQKPRTFMRFGNTSTGVWQPWKSTSAWHTSTGLPTSDMGDIYVDGIGWYSFNGSAYARTDLSLTTIADLKTRAGGLETRADGLETRADGLEALVMGRGQSWQTVARSLGVAYTNSTGRPILVSMLGVQRGASGNVWIQVNGRIFSRTGLYNSIGANIPAWACIPPGSTYEYAGVDADTFTFYEYR
ncbi:pyocin knob domain-containing protein [Achromobacter agilis]|uniref:Tail fiber protein n=1 Tax=Achromobacter agilis TaxID=1353888 RepID=A0A446CL49_9BURK|nr:pyocin knob domain-containing protein [Achromobacter agilis]SSW68521.1 hypothetical protein AGI3411_03713 [Achromobacter agilis]